VFKVSDSSPSPGLKGSKPNPKYMTFREAVAHFELLSGATRQLCVALLDGDRLSEHQRAELLALKAILERSDGE